MTDTEEAFADIARIRARGNADTDALIMEVLLKYPPGSRAIYCDHVYLVSGYADWMSTIGIRIRYLTQPQSQITVGLSLIRPFLPYHHSSYPGA